jgi:hypothetical protein
MEKHAAVPVIFLTNGQCQTFMDPSAKPKERNIGARRPKIRHVSQSVEPRTRRERRAIKKAARGHLKGELLEEFEDAT